MKRISYIFLLLTPLFNASAEALFDGIWIDLTYEFSNETISQCRCRIPQLYRTKIPPFVDGGRLLRLAELHSTKDDIHPVSTDGGSRGDSLRETFHVSRTSCTRRLDQRPCPTNGARPEDGPASPGRGDNAAGIRTKRAQGSLLDPYMALYPVKRS